MSEFLNNHSLQTAKLLEYSKKLIAGENGNAMYDQYQNEIENATAEEAMEVLDQLLQSDIPFEVVKENVGKIMNVFYKSLNSENLPLIPQNHFLHYLMLENRAMEIHMQELKGLLKADRKSVV